jgi:hypothetical protein
MHHVVAPSVFEMAKLRGGSVIELVIALSFKSFSHLLDRFSFEFVEYGLKLILSSWLTPY